MDAYLFHQGTNNYAYRYLGCRMHREEDQWIYTFRVWAPNAERVALVGDFLNWDNGEEMLRTTSAGIYETKISSPVSLEGAKYKYKIQKNGITHLKGDPYAVFSEGGSSGATIILHDSEFLWQDENWLSHRRATVKSKDKAYIPAPINIYEVHLGSFMRRGDGTFLTYREIAEILVPYVKTMGYTHIEFLPVMEYPFDASWGYQVCAFYAPTSRFGTPDDLRYLINACHTAGVGVILDWVPAHFPKDEWGLYEFDGAPLYEYQGKDRMESPSWGTRYFDVGREEVQSFLISNALYWLREFHIDGLRCDAVAAMLYLDFDRKPGEWIPNRDGGNQNAEAIAFFRKLNQSIYAEKSDVLMIAEESTAFHLVTHPVSEGGLGFNLKWNMGWANDFYSYLSTDPLYRKGAHKALNFPITYAFSENYILPISHDEVVHGKKSFLDKMFGDYEDKFSSFRAAMLYMMTFPGKKMLFMGTEYGQFREWDYSASLEWFMLDYPLHRELREFVASLNRFYLEHSALWERDFIPEGFSWIYPDDSDHNAVAYTRHSEDETLTVLISFAGSVAKNYRLRVSEKGKYKVLFSTFVGVTEEILTTKEDGKEQYLELDLPALSGLVLSHIKENVFTI